MSCRRHSNKKTNQRTRKTKLEVELERLKQEKKTPGEAIKTWRTYQKIRTDKFPDKKQYNKTPSSKLETGTIRALTKDKMEINKQLHDMQM